jgi:hypothetical protein
MGSAIGASSWRAAIPLIVFLAIGAVLATSEVTRQWRIARLESVAAAADSLPREVALARLKAAEQACGDVCGGRVQVASGAAQALIATRSPPGVEREALAAVACSNLQAAIADQPQSGERWAWLSVAESARSGNQAHQQAVLALERSYRLAPFVRELALWRARFAGSVWGSLDELSRERALDEVARLSLIDPSQAEVAQLAFSDPVASRALDQRMARRGVMAVGGGF